jgi:hypothetical protein
MINLRNDAAGIPAAADSNAYGYLPLHVGDRPLAPSQIVRVRAGTVILPPTVCMLDADGYLVPLTLKADGTAAGPLAYVNVGPVDLSASQVDGTTEIWDGGHYYHNSLAWPASLDTFEKRVAFLLSVNAHMQIAKSVGIAAPVANPV